MRLLPDAAKLKEVFNWFASPAARSYTLGEAFQHYVQHRPYDEIHTNQLGFTNAGRLLERVHMAAGILTAGLLVVCAPASLPALAIAGGFLVGYKIMGLAAGKLADGVASGRFYNPEQPRPRL